MFTPVREPADYSKYLKSGDELIAIGSKPVWLLRINPSKNQLIFKLADGDSLTSTSPERQSEAGEVIRYSAKTESGQLTVQFKPDSCLDAATGQPYDYQVQVEVGGKKYDGCGVSLQKVALLQDIWVLTEFQGQTIKADDARRDVPRLEITLTEGRVTGTTGCNRLSGTIKADTRQIAFGPLITTKMACIGSVGELETDFLKALTGSLVYQVNDGKLTLTGSNNVKLTFKKVD
ncbi:hypothetical protein GCM10028805_24540 [Spirosoma harenae]